MILFFILKRMDKYKIAAIVLGVIFLIIVAIMIYYFGFYKQRDPTDPSIARGNFHLRLTQVPRAELNNNLVRIGNVQIAPPFVYNLVWEIITPLPKDGTQYTIDLEIGSWKRTFTTTDTTVIVNPLWFAKPGVVSYPVKAKIGYVDTNDKAQSFKPSFLDNSLVIPNLIVDALSSNSVPNRYDNLVGTPLLYPPSKPFGGGYYRLGRRLTPNAPLTLYPTGLVTTTPTESLIGNAGQNPFKVIGYIGDSPIEMTFPQLFRSLPSAGRVQQVAYDSFINYVRVHQNNYLWVFTNGVGSPIVNPTSPAGGYVFKFDIAQTFGEDTYYTRIINDPIYQFTTTLDTDG